LSILLLAGSTIAAPPENRPKIGLVLSGGGAKGFAHVGVLKVLEEAGIPIDYIAGTSAGGIIGGLYAMGFSADSLEKIVKSQDWENLLSNDVAQEYISQSDKSEQARYNFTLPIESKRIALSTGLLNGQNVMDILTYLSYGYHDVTDFSKLPIPFLCIAADLTTGKEVVLKEGYLPQAIRASMAVPAAFSPVEINGQLLVDGGILNNFPIDRCKEMGADIIIGVDIVDSLKSKDEIKEIPAVIAQLVKLMSIQRFTTNAKMIDIYVRPILTEYSVSSFSKRAVDSLIVRGEEAARRVYPQLIRLRDSLKLERATFPKKQNFNENTELIINHIEVTGTQKSTVTFALGQIGINKKEVTLKQIRQGIATLYGTGNYEYVNYRILGDEDKTLQISVKERSNNRLNAGLHYDSDMKAGVLLNATIHNHKFYGSRFSADAKLSDLPMFAARYTLNRGWKPGLFVGLMFADDRFYSYDGTTKNAEVNLNLTRFQLSTQSFTSKSSRLTLGASVEHFNLVSVIGDFAVENNEYDTFFNLVGEFEHNTLNDKYFPTKGVSITATAKGVTYFKDYNPYFIGNFSVLTSKSFTNRLTILPSLNTRFILGDNESFFHRTFFGGVQQTDYLNVQVPFYGLRRMEIITGSTGVASLETRYRIGQKLYLSLIGQVGTYSEDNSFFTNNTWIYGSALKISFSNKLVGPIDFTISTSDQNNFLIPFFSLGYWF
jgi:NTE family protein